MLRFTEELLMSKNRLFHGNPTRRLIVSVDLDTVSKVDRLIGWQSNKRHPACGNRSEFVRQAIERELARWQSDD